MIQRRRTSAPRTRRVLAALGSVVIATALVTVPASAVGASTTTDGGISTSSTDGH